MALVHVADLPLVLPTPIGIFGLCPSIGASIASPALTLSATLTGALSLNASFTATPPTLGFYLGSAVSGLIFAGANLAVGASLGLPACSFGVNISAGISVVADLSVSFSAMLSVGLPSLSGLLSASIGAYAFTWTGPAANLGAALTTELASTWPDGAPSAGACNALILVAPTSVASVLLAFLDGLGTPGPGLTYVTKLSALSALSLSTAAALPQASASLNASISACASITAAMTPQINVALPTLAFEAAAVADVAIPNLKAAIAAGFQAPSVDVVLSATADLAASASGPLATLGLTLGRFDALFGVYTYSGTGTGLGAAVTAGITDPSDVTAVVLATTDAFSWTTLTGFFGGAL